MVLSKRSVIYRWCIIEQWPINILGSSLKYILSETSMFLNYFSEGHSIKGFDCPMLDAAKCSQCFFFNNILTLNVRTHSRTEIIVCDWKGYCNKISQYHLVGLVKHLLCKANRFNLLIFCIGEFNLNSQTKQYIYSNAQVYVHVCVYTQAHV
jgi:hypothetical protein